MITSLSTKHITLTPLEQNKFETLVHKLTAVLKDLQQDLVKLDIHITPDKNLLYPRLHKSRPSNYKKEKPTIANLQGTMSLFLPKQVLHTKFISRNLLEGLEKGFKHLFSEVRKYKDLHFTSDSHYPDQSTIRKISPQF